MLKKDYFNAIKAALETAEDPETDEYSLNDLMAFCEKEVERLEASAARMKERQAEKTKQDDELAEKVYSVLSEDFMDRDEIFNALTETYPDIDTTLSKVQYRLNSLAKEGRVEKQETRKTDENGKKRTCMGYRLAEVG